MTITFAATAAESPLDNESLETKYDAEIAAIDAQLQKLEKANDNTASAINGWFCDRDSHIQKKYDLAMSTAKIEYQNECEQLPEALLQQKEVALEQLSKIFSQSIENARTQFDAERAKLFVAGDKQHSARKALFNPQIAQLAQNRARLMEEAARKVIG